MADEAIFRIIKLVLVGAAETGKSCLMVKFAEGSFSEEYVSTIGIDFKLRCITLPGEEGRTKVQIWDTAGQQRFRTISTSYYRGAFVICVCCSVDRRDSFEELPTFLQYVRDYGSSGVHTVLAVLKTDLPEEEWEIDGAELQAFADEHNLPMFHTSAKTGSGVDALFTEASVAYVAKSSAPPAAPTPVEASKEPESEIEQQNDGPSLQFEAPLADWLPDDVRPLAGKFEEQMIDTVGDLAIAGLSDRLSDAVGLDASLRTCLRLRLGRIV
eukprot:PLAT13598.1.p1 GENE.PLAT13598.1~~PLAT13598.1.p1  ORF type:complete len:270 (+),score=72.91 PLAT13598.1:29-838(+)